MKSHITLPSGTSILQAKKDAKKLKKQRTDITHTQALNIICKKYDYDGTWNQFMAEMERKPVYSGSDNPHRNLLIIATNHLLENDLISLQTPKGYYQNRMNPKHEKEGGHVFIQIEGRDAVILWSDAGHEELRISVWWDYDHSKHPQANKEGSYKEQFHTASPLVKRGKYKEFVGVVCSAWLERQDGKYLQGRGNKHLYQIYTRRDNLAPLQGIPNELPIDYRCEGPFHL